MARKKTTKKKATKSTAEPSGARYQRGDRVAIVAGRKARGTIGEITWVGRSKFGDGWRYGLRADDGEVHWVDEGHLGPATDSPTPNPNPTNPTPTTPNPTATATATAPPADDDLLDQVEFLGRHRPRFLTQGDYGELRWLRAGERPAMVDEIPDEPLHDVVEWFAEEADGGVLGRLRLPEVPPALQPIVYLSNEACANVSAPSLIDHLGSPLLDQPNGEVDPLLRFCRKHGLPAPRSMADTDRLVRSLRLSSERLHAAKLPAVTVETLRKWAEQAPPPPLPEKARGPALGDTTPPLSEEVHVVDGPDGTPWLLARKKGRSLRATVHRWTGDGFELTGELPTNEAIVYQGHLAYHDRGHVVVRAGRKTVERLPLDGSLVTLVASGSTLVAYDTWDGRVFVRRGDAFERLTDAAGERGTPIWVSEHEVAIFGAESKAGRELAPLLVDLETGKTKKWPRSAGCTRFLRLGSIVAGVGYEFVQSFDLEAKTWSRPKKSQHLGQPIPLADGDAVVFADNGNVFRLRRKTFALRKLGKLRLRRERGSTACEVAPGTLLVVGGLRHTTGTLLEPELFDLNTGKSKALPGRAALLRAQER